MGLLLKLLISLFVRLDRLGAFLVVLVRYHIKTVLGLRVSGKHTGRLLASPFLFY
jgi:hypothetical protein